MWRTIWVAMRNCVGMMLLLKQKTASELIWSRKILVITSNVIVGLKVVCVGTLASTFDRMCCHPAMTSFRSVLFGLTKPENNNRNIYHCFYFQ